MGYGRFVGRVGALAVALGAGAAIASMPAVAFADETGPGSATVPSSSVGSASGGSSADSKVSGSTYENDGTPSSSDDSLSGSGVDAFSDAADDDAADIDADTDTDAADAAADAADADDVDTDTAADDAAAVRVKPASPEASAQEEASGVDAYAVDETDPEKFGPGLVADAPAVLKAQAAISRVTEAEPAPAAVAEAAEVDGAGDDAAAVRVKPASPEASAQEEASGVDAYAVDETAQLRRQLTGRDTADAARDEQVAATKLVRQDVIDDAVRGFFNAAENGLLEYFPPSPLREFLIGALQLVRKTLFNQAPLVVSSSPTISELDETITGKMIVIDMESDTFTYTIQAAPQHGTAAVDAGGSWTYTPDITYAGIDSFTVLIDADERWLNLSNLGSDGDREVKIQVGGQTFIDLPDVAVGLSDASGRLTIARNFFGQKTATVTLNDVTSDTEATWLDTSGLLGSVTFGDVEALYSSLEASAARGGDGVDLTLEFDGANGSPHAVLLDNIEFGKGADGSYQFTGRLAPTELDPNGVDNYDIVGKHLNQPYNNFLDTFDGSVELDFAGAKVHLDTLSTLLYLRQDLYEQDSEAKPQPVPHVATASYASAGLANLAASATAPLETSPVTASLALGRSVVIGRDDGSVEVWTGGERKPLHDAGWDAPIEQLIEYNRALKDDQGNTIDSTFSGYISGTTLTVTALGVGSTVKVGSVITGDGVALGTTITRFIEEKAVCADQACTTFVGKGAGGSEGYTGTYEVNNSQYVGRASQNASPPVPSGNTSPGNTAPGITFTQKNVPAVSPGFIAGLGAGSIQYWQTTTGWVELRGIENYGNPGPLDVTAMATFGESLVVGNKHGDVDMWSPPDAVKPGWTQLLAGGGSGGKVTAIVEVGSPGTQGYGVVTVSETAGVDFWDTTWQKTDLSSLNSPVTAATAYGTGVALGLEDSTVHSWDGTVAATQGWTVLREEGWGQAVSAILPYEQGLIVGLGGAGKPGAVEYYNGDGGAGGGWLELQGTGWGSPVTQMINYRSDASGDGVVVGLGDGSVHMWNGPLQKPAGATSTLYAGNSLKLGDALYSNNGGYTLTLQTDGNLVLRGGEKQLWASGTNGKGVAQAELQRDGNFVLYKAGGGVVHGTGQNGAAIPTATNPAQNVLLTVDDTGNVVLYNGARDVLWKTDTSDGQRLASVWTWWTQLHDSNWDTGGGAVTALVPVSLSAKNASGNVVLQDGVIVGLNNGAVEQWSGGGDVVAGYSSSWTEIAKGNIPENLRNHAADALAVKDEFKCSDWKCSQSGALKDAVDFARGLTDGGGSGSPAWQSENGIGSAADPIFGNPKFQKGSHVGGTHYTLAYYNEITPDAVSYSFPDGGGTPSIQAGLDVIPVAYGYTYVPDGFFPKMYSDNWSFGLLAAAGGGASVNINVGDDPQASLWGPEKELAKTEKYELTEIGAFAVDAGVNLGANFTVTGLPQDQPVVSAHAWVFGGMLGTFNTAAAPDKFNFGFNWYPDIDASDFKDINAASATVTLTPYANFNYGLFVPEDIPLIGGWSFLKLSLGYKNPLYATVCVDANSLCPAAGGSGVANFYGTINDGTDSGDAGSTLTVTKQALFNPTKLAVGQLVTGDGVESGTTITTEDGENYTVKICNSAGENCTDSTQAFDDGNLTAYTAGSVASIAMGASGLLTVHAGALETFTDSLSYDMKIPLYEFSDVVELV